MYIYTPMFNLIYQEMKTVYKAVMNRLQAEVQVLKWIELDTGQLKLIGNGTELPIIYPCALIGIRIAESMDITDKIQNCKAIVSVDIIFDPIPFGKTSANADDNDREQALQPYEVIAEVYKALQGFETINFNSLSRNSQGEEFHDKLFVYKLEFNCEFEDLTAE